MYLFVFHFHQHFHFHSIFCFYLHIYFSFIFIFISFHFIFIFVDHDELVQTVNSHLSDRFTKNSNTPTDNNKHSIQKERNSKIIYEDNSSQEIENRNEYKNENKNENGSNECTGRDLETKEEKGRNMKNDCSKTTNNKEAKNVLPNVPSWESSIWPEIKRKIFATLEAAQTSIVHRPGTFEFLGYDILIDANGVPWILEVSPSVRVYLSPSVRVYSSLSVFLYLNPFVSLPV